MDLFDKFFLPPNAEHLHLVKYLIMIVYFINLPFISLMIGGTFFSLIFNIADRQKPNPIHSRFTKDLIDTLIFRKFAGIILGVLPLFVLVFAFGQMLYQANTMIVPFMIYTTIIAAVGITLVYFYQASYKMRENGFWLHITGGVLGLLVLLFAYLVFMATTSLAMEPGRWLIINAFDKLLFSWNVVARFLHFITAALMVSGAAIVFFFFNWGGGKQGLDEEYASFVLKFGGGTALGFSLLQPLFVLWNIDTLPTVTLSPVVFGITIAVVVLLLVITYTILRLLQTGDGRRGTGVFVLLIIVFIVMIVNNQIAMNHAIKNHTDELAMRAEERAAELKAEKEREMGAQVKVDLALGENVYQTVCHTCHRFDQKIVGPAYDDVLPKYLDHQDQLINFIRKPVKVNPDLPPMPQLGLSESQIRSVAAYLIKTYEEENKK